MGVDENLQKNLNTYKALRDRIDEENDKIPWKVGAKLAAYTIITMFINIPLYYETPRLHIVFIAFVVIAFVRWLIKSPELRAQILLAFANILLMIYWLWIFIKSIVLMIYYLGLGLFGLGKKVATKYDNLDEEKKTVIKRVVLILLVVAAKEIVKVNLKEDSTFVDPHHVSGYTRKDGTSVSSYFRDGDGNPLTNLTKEQGGGFFRK